MKKASGSKRVSLPAQERTVAGRITVENINVPGYSTRVEAVKYEAMRKAILKILPFKEPGLTQNEIRQAVLPYLPRGLFPGGAKAGWWSKMVQLDLEAKGVLDREATRPLRWHQRPVE